DHAEQVALAFPWLFPLGLSSKVMKFNDDDMNWLLNQYDQRMALCAGFVSYIWSVRLRKANILTVSRMWKNNSKVLEELQERIDNGLYEEIEECLKFPDSDEAKSLARELEKLLSSTVISSPYSNGANKRALTAMMAMNRYFGPRHAYFIMVNPMVELTPLYKALQGESGPGLNDYAYAKAYVELHDRVQEAFFGIPKESKSSPLPWQLRNPTPFGYTVV
ncbi:hypothetical protein HDU76_012318, partial [Blyttiomyces sp. JEL0837]